MCAVCTSEHVCGRPEGQILQEARSECLVYGFPGLWFPCCGAYPGYCNGLLILQMYGMNLLRFRVVSGLLDLCLLCIWSGLEWYSGGTWMAFDRFQGVSVRLAVEKGKLSSLFQYGPYIGS